MKIPILDICQGSEYDFDSHRMATVKHFVKFTRKIVRRIKDFINNLNGEEISERFYQKELKDVSCELLKIFWNSIFIENLKATVSVYLNVQE